MKHSEIDFGYIMIFSQFVHGMYNEKIEETGETHMQETELRSLYNA